MHKRKRRRIIETGMTNAIIIMLENIDDRDKDDDGTLVIMMIVNCLLYRITNDNDRTNSGIKYLL